MRVEDFSRTTWLIIALLVGSALAWLQLQWGTSNARETTSQQMFERQVLRQPAVDAKTHDKLPYVTSVTIYPALQAEFTVASAHGRYKPFKSLVRYWQFKLRPDGQWDYQPYALYVDQPYTPQPAVYEAGVSNDAPFPSVRDYFKAISAQYPWVSYRYAWWYEPQWCYTLWIGSAVLIIGIVWPTVMNKLVLAGYGKKSEEQWSLWGVLFGKSLKRERRNQTKASAQVATSPTSMSAEELSRLEAMEAEMQDFLTTPKEPGGEVDESAVEEIRKFDAAPIESPVEQAKTEEEKDYGGEFYPTVAHGKKKGE